jgi:hypothetical protein
VTWGARQKRYEAGRSHVIATFINKMIGTVDIPRSRPHPRPLRSTRRILPRPLTMAAPSRQPLLLQRRPCREQKPTRRTAFPSKTLVIRHIRQEMPFAGVLLPESCHVLGQGKMDAGPHANRKHNYSPITSFCLLAFGGSAACCCCCGSASAMMVKGPVG